MELSANQNITLKPTGTLRLPTSSKVVFQIFTILWIFVGLFALIFNILQIVVIVGKSRKSSNRRKKFDSSQIFLLNLSIIDGLVGLILLIALVIPLAFQHSSSFVMVLSILLHVSWLISILVLISVTIDRLALVLKPIKYRYYARKFAIYACIISWFCGLVLAILIWYKFASNELTSLDSILSILLPCLTLPTSVFLICCYFMIWRRSTALVKRLQEYEIKHYQKDNKTEYFGTPGQKSNLKTSSSKELKYTKLATVIVGLFMVCWLPISLMYIFAYTGSPRIDPWTRVQLLSSFQLLAAFNSVINPTIYLRTFRNILSDFGTKVCCHKKNGTKNVNEDCVMVPLKTKDLEKKEYNENNFDEEQLDKKIYEIYY
ncbi:adenosine receptor A3-like [Clytia hemisphaerica]|uniref:G-protein coupled receptors family 1 profile domain-containing protein n=1 Tax=Clytia hemisphaerica TaxID=252671 RepID=A0A7M5V9I2_9CNID